MKDLAELHAAALAMAAEFRMSREEIAERYSRVRDREYWESLSPALTIGRLSQFDELPQAADTQRAVEHFYRRERYFETPQLLTSSTLAQLNAAIDAVTAAGWPALFALVGDLFWLCPRIAAVRQLVTSRIGDGYQQIPHVWLHIVRKVDGAGGWLPHFDGFRPARVSVWLALTEATTTNGCMFLVPPNALPESFRTLKIETLATIDVMRAMHATRALPVPAGAAVGWDFDVFHWGGRAVNPDAERRSISMEFLGRAGTADRDELPLLDLTGPLPPLDVRLKVIGIGLESYAKREPLSQRFTALAGELTKLC